MNGTSLQRNQKAALIVFIVAPIMIAILAFFFSKQMYDEQQQRMTLVKNSYEVREQLLELRNDLIQSETGQNIFLLTGTRSYLQPSLFAESDAFVRLTYLSNLLSDRPTQLDHLNHLRPLIETALAEHRSAIRSKEFGQREKALQTAHESQDSILPEQISALIREMQADEDVTLSVRLKILQSDVDARQIVSTVLVCVTAGLVVGAGVLLLRIRKLQSIITICAWTKRVNFNGKWTRMEEFLWNRFRVKVSHGISEEAFEGVVGMVGKNITVSEKFRNAQPDASSGS